MPRLEGLSFNTETIRNYFSFYISMYLLESRQSINLGEIVRQFTRKGVVDICAKCTQQGYYIVGLEREELIQAASPEQAEYATGRAVVPYNLMLGLYVRRFTNVLTGDELYYWSKQSSERILYEMNQVGSVRPNDVYVPKYTTGVDLAALAITPDKIAEGTITNFGANTVPASAIREAIDESNRQEEKPKLYNIIRRPKLCSSPSS